MLRGHGPKVQDSQAHAIVNSGITARPTLRVCLFAKLGLVFFAVLTCSPKGHHQNSRDAAAKIAKLVVEPRQGDSFTVRYSTNFGRDADADRLAGRSTSSERARRRFVRPRDRPKEEEWFPSLPGRRGRARVRNAGCLDRARRERLFPGTP